MTKTNTRREMIWKQATALKATVLLRALWSHKDLKAVSGEKAEQMGITIFEEKEPFS